MFSDLYKNSSQKWITFACISFIPLGNISLRLFFFFFIKDICGQRRSNPFVFADIFHGWKKFFFDYASLTALADTFSWHAYSDKWWNLYHLHISSRYCHETSKNVKCGQWMSNIRKKIHTNICMHAEISFTNVIKYISLRTESNKG